MAITNPPTLGADPQTLSSSVLNGMISPLVTDYNGNIDDSNVATGAGIASAKLNLTAINQAVANSGTTTLSGANTLSGVTTMSAKRLNLAKGADIASDTTTTIWATDGNYAHITGTTTITSFGTATQAGATAMIEFDGILTLTHNSTSLILPTGSNITTAAGDTAIVVAETTANARVIAYLRKDGTAVAGGYTPTAANALSGSVIQIVNVETGANTTGTTAIPLDDTIPQSNEGDQYMTLAITPNNASNKLKIDVVFNYSSNGSTQQVAALFQDSTANALACATQFSSSVDKMMSLTFTYYMAAGTTSATTFKVRAGDTAGGTTSFNGIGSARKFGGVFASSITISEIKI